MRLVVLVLAALVCARPVAAEDARFITDCLREGEMAEAVSNAEVVRPVVALRAARRAAPGADMVRARLCRADGKLVYIIVALRTDGRFVHVTVDGASGKVAAMR
jgi:uncharacterized membrane protein YkoI